MEKMTYLPSTDSSGEREEEEQGLCERNGLTYLHREDDNIQRGAEMMWGWVGGE